MACSGTALLFAFHNSKHFFFSSLNYELTRFYCTSYMAATGNLIYAQTGGLETCSPMLAHCWLLNCRLMTRCMLAYLDSTVCLVRLLVFEKVQIESTML
jgi:hypothetical protein